MASRAQDTIFGGDGEDLIRGGTEGDDLRGDRHNDALFGDEGDDVLFGGADNDTLYGGADQDELIGGTGVDTMFGGTGNDIYWVQEAGDVVSEVSFEYQGVDTVHSLIDDYTLTVNVEILVLEATAHNGTGNELANRIVGNEFANTINGSLGNDILTGRGGLTPSSSHRARDRPERQRRHHHRLRHVGRHDPAGQLGVHCSQGRRA